MLNEMKSNRFMNREFPFYIMHAEHDCQNVPGVHGHDFIELVYVVRGDAEHAFEGEHYDLRAGDVFIINPGEVHTYRIALGNQIEIINCLFLPHLISDSLLHELGITQSMDYFYIHPFLNKSERFNHHLNLRGQDAIRVLSILETMNKETQSRSSGYSILIRLQMIELLVLLSRYYGISQSAHKTARGNDHEIVVRRICGYLERNYHQKITLVALAQLFNSSVRQLNRIFKEETGVSVIEKVHQVRIEKAKLLLAETNEKVIAVASLVGYEDPAFFSRLFTRQVGCAPGKYRQHVCALTDTGTSPLEEMP